MTDRGSTASRPPRQSFAALRNTHYRRYFVCTALSMMGDSTEHVIS
jgi:hypothetical protein